MDAITNLDAKVLHRLMDGRNYRLVDIAVDLEVSKSSVVRAIRRLRADFEIHGGKQGMWLDDIDLHFNIKRGKL